MFWWVRQGLNAKECASGTVVSRANSLPAARFENERDASKVFRRPACLVNSSTCSRRDNMKSLARPFESPSGLCAWQLGPATAVEV